MEGGTGMRADIAKEDVLKLREEFIEYTTRAEQYEFPFLAMVHKKIDFTIEVFDTVPIEELNSMFRVVYRIIGKDKTDYLEDK
jgi:ribosomal protein S4E